MEKVLGTAKVRKNGQLTIPKDVVNTLEIQDGDYVSIVKNDSKVYIKKIVP